MVIRNKKYNKLTALKPFPSENSKYTWLFECDCGKRKTIMPSNVEGGLVKSCGCLYKESNKTHGMSKTTTYSSWQAMLARCNNHKHISYKNYGGRGTKVCKRWEKFENFYKDMGKRPNGKTLDRVDNNKNYTASNCQWASKEDQNNNAKRNIYVSVNKVKIPFNELARMFKIKPVTLYARIFNYKWKLERALITPARKYRS